MNCIKKLNEKIEGIGKRWELVLVILLSALMVLGIIIGMGTLTSGYHLVDDHEFLEWIHQMRNEGKSVWELIAR